MEAQSSSDNSHESEQSVQESPTHPEQQTTPASQPTQTPTSSKFSKLRNAIAASSPSRLRNTIAALALGTAAAAIGTTNAACSALPEAEMEARHNQKIANLTKQLERCGELKDFSDGIISMGTMGVRRLYHDRENRIRLNKGVSKVDQVFFLWPPPQSPEAVTVEGDPSKLSAVNFGSYSGVQFKAEYTDNLEKKESFVIQNSMVGAHSEADPSNPGIHRYVIIIEWR